MKQFILLLTAITTCTVQAQQINGSFTDFARNDIWGNTVINNAIFQTSDHITLCGYYEGAQRSGVVNGVFVSHPNKIPLVMQITPSGIIRNDFGGNGAFLVSSVTSSGGSTQADRVYVANTSTTANSNQLIVAGHQDDGDGFLIKTWPTGSRPTAFNNGNITTLSGGGASAKGYIEDWHTGFYTYSVRLNGATFGNAKVLLSMFSKETGAPYIIFGDSGTTRISAPQGNIVNQSRPVRLVLSTGGNAKFYVAFSTIASLGPGVGVALCRINAGDGKIDSSFGTNGYKSYPTPTAYHVTSLLVNSDESVTVGGYDDDGQQSTPSFMTFKTNGTVTSTIFGSISSEPRPGLGSKNIGAKKTTINGEERIVFTYAHPANNNNQYRIAIASINPINGPGPDPLPYTSWLGNGFVSAEPTSIITALNNTGFIVTGKATRADGTFAGVVLKYTMNGLLDASFATQGVLVINARQGGSPWTVVSQMPNGKYLVGGTASFVPTALKQKALMLTRFNSNGSLDSSFGTNGILYPYQSNYDRGLRQVYPLSNGKFLIGGTYTNYTNEPGIGTGVDGPKATVYKFNEDGSPDYSFGPFNNGRYHFPGYVGMSLGSMEVIDDEIYVSGNTTTSIIGTNRSIILKLSAGGNNTGSYLPNLRSITRFVINETNGEAYAGGRSLTGMTQLCKIRKGTTTMSGTPDSSYGTNGVVDMPVINSGQTSGIQLIKIRSGGVLTVNSWASGTSGNISYGIFFSLINSNGIVDAAFGPGGAKFLQLPGANSITVNQYKWAADGNSLFIFGEANVSSSAKSFVCKVDLNGDLDTAYGTSGILWTNTSFLGAQAFDNNGNLLALKDYGFFYGGALQKLQIPADVYNRIKSGSWTGTIDNDWFKPGNWAEGVVPDAYTEVVIANGSVLIAANQQAFAYSVRVLGSASFTVGANSTLTITKHNP